MKKTKKVLLVVLCVLVALLAAAYVVPVFYFQNHFLPGTFINESDISNLSKEDATDKIGEYTIVINERDSQEKLTGDQVGLEYSGSDLGDIISSQEPLLWPVKLFEYYVNDSSRDIADGVKVQINEKSFSKAVNGLDCLDANSVIKPKNAYIQKKNNRYVVANAVMGTKVNKTVFEKKLKNAIENMETEFSLEENDCYVDPQILSDDKKLNETCENVNKYFELKVTYSIGKNKVVLDSTATKDWITVDKDFNVDIDDSMIKEWVSTNLSEKYNTVGATRTFKSGNGKKCTVSGGTYGWTIDEDAEVEKIKELFVSMEDQDREPIYSQEAVGHGNYDWGKTYAEVDIDGQHMYYYENGKVIFDTDVITGKPDGQNDTTKGVFTCLEKMRDKVLRGPKQNGVYEWESPVSYWMRVTWSGIGFHDATWQNGIFGGTRYKDGYGSHGCINLSLGDAEKLYGIIEVGCPVIVH